MIDPSNDILDMAVSPELMKILPIEKSIIIETLYFDRGR